MFPEYFPKVRERDLVLLERNSLYDNMGNRLASGDPSACMAYIVNHPCAVITGDFVDKDFEEFLYELVYDEKTRVLASKQGRPIMARVSTTKRETRWIVSARSWGNRESPDPQWLNSLGELYRYYQLGYYPTPSSLGVGLMRRVWKESGFKRHTSLSLAAEGFVREHAVGGIVATPGKGRKYRSLAMLDMASAWVSQYVLHPTGTAEAINELSDLSMYFEYFVECDIYIPHTLALGPFPVRTGKRNGQRVVYPTEEGIYRSVYLWRVQIADCKKAGCYIHIKRGYAWRDRTTDNSFWSEKAYSLRMEAPNEFIARVSKSINVAAIGRQFRSRETYTIKPIVEGQSTDGLKLVVNADHEPLDMYLSKEIDQRSAFMPHWYAYTIAVCNSHVYNFALPYAEQGRLVMIDYDSIMVLEGNDTSRFIRKKTFDAANIKPGTWLYVQLHNVEILNHRSFKSDELVKMPGVMKG